ncbi:hypothetical protein HELRODRAFT_111498 [Helobdella robusta]|uniref:PID domain-containing protein n=1 Tax=Helobdella robusta TaxID=6412 RepID=T1EFB9_HELRO|nr:hypothetical protein HELRODRAFT_111498 [Helobdella robusta]ESO05043.1 hypothetical protein HELRODRAFT_111498 [Helobdella robusta]
MSNPPTERLNDSMEEKKNGKNKKNNGKLQKQPSNEEKFDGPGVNFKGKLIGFESVSESKGERMCQVAMAKLKAAVIALGVHKEKITLNLSLEGITLYDDKMEDQLYRHLIEKISFVSRDASDSRAFGYVFNEDDEKYRFCAIKTEKSAEPVMATLKELFKAYYEKQEGKSGNDSTSQTEESANQTSTAAQPSDGATTPAASNAAADSVLLENKITPMESVSDFLK